MELHFTGHNIELTTPLKEYAQEKLQPLEKRDSHIIKLDVSLHVENVTHIAEATIHLRGSELHATASAENMYAAIDLLADKSKAIVTKHKEKQISQHR